MSKTNREQAKPITFNEKLGNINPLIGFLLFFIFTILLSSLFIWLSSSSEIVNKFGYSDIVDFATAAGAVAALIVGIVSSYLVYVSFQAQIKFNNDQKEILKNQTEKLEKEIAERKQHEIIQKEEFEKEKIRSRGIEDRNEIFRMIQSLREDINTFRYENYTGAYAIYNSVIASAKKEFEQLDRYIDNFKIKVWMEMTVNHYRDFLTLNDESRLLENLNNCLDIVDTWHVSKKNLSIDNISLVNLNELLVLINAGKYYKEPWHEKVELNWCPVPNDVRKYLIGAIAEKNITLWETSNSILFENLAEEEYYELLNFNDTKPFYPDWSYLYNRHSQQNDTEQEVIKNIFYLRSSQGYKKLEPTIKDKFENISPFHIDQFECFIGRLNSIKKLIEDSHLDINSKAQFREFLIGFINANFSSDLFTLNRLSNSCNYSYNGSIISKLNLDFDNFDILNPFLRWVERIYDADSYSSGESDELDHLNPEQIDQGIRSKLTTHFRTKLTTLIRAN